MAIDISSALAQKYAILGQQAHAAQTQADADARLRNAQADATPGEAAARNAAAYGQAQAANGQAEASRANAGVMNKAAGNADRLASAEIGLHGAQAGLFGSETAKNAYMISPHAEMIRGYARNMGYVDGPRTGNPLLQPGGASTIPTGSNMINVAPPPTMPAGAPTDESYGQNTSFSPIMIPGSQDDPNKYLPGGGYAAGISYVGGGPDNGYQSTGGNITDMTTGAPAGTPGFQIVQGTQQITDRQTGEVQGNAAGNRAIKGGKRGMVDATDGKNKVPGKGNGTVDTELSALAPGEAVLNKAAADHLGRDTIDLLNAAGAQKMGLEQQPNHPAAVPVAQLKNVPGSAAGKSGAAPAGKGGPPAPAGKKDAPAAKSGGSSKDKGGSISPAMVQALMQMMQAPPGPMPGPAMSAPPPGAIPPPQQPMPPRPPGG